MSHLRNLAKISSGRAARSIWLAGTSRPWCLARTPRTMFTTSRRSSVEPNQHQEQVRQGEKLSGVEPPRFETLPDDDSPSRSPLTFPTFLVLGVCLLTGWAVYDIYGTMTMWPEDVRSDLRQGVKHRNQGNLPLSIQHLQQAWEKAKSLPLDLFGPDPLLKTSGIAILLAGVLEDNNKKEGAYKVYQEALRQIQSTYLDLPPDAPQPNLGSETLKLLTPAERMRAAALAYKLGGMASELGKPEKEEEKWLTWSVNAILMVMMEAPTGSETKEVSRIPPSPPGSRKLHTVMSNMRLPSWAWDHDIAAPFEALGTFYNDRNKSSYALPLYLQAISILIPPPPLKSSPEDRYRGAGLMKQVSFMMFKYYDDFEERLIHATSWAQKALDVVIDTRQSQKGKFECETAYIGASYHLALMRLFSGENDKARELFEIMMKESNAMGLRDVAALARTELQKLDDLEMRGNNKLKVKTGITLKDLRKLDSETRGNGNDKEKTVILEELQKLDSEIGENGED